MSAPDLSNPSAAPRTVRPVTALLMAGGIVAFILILYFILRPDGTPVLEAEVKESIPRATKDAYTQGLEFIDGALWEGTGGTQEINGHRSVIRRYDPKTGEIMAETEELLATRPIMDARMFGEGITALDGFVYQLTWRSNKVLRYAKEEVFLKSRAHKPPKLYDHQGEGWGLTNDGKRLIMSDGTSKIYLVDPAEFRIIETLEVTDTKGLVPQLNELEYVPAHGNLYANLYGQDRIAVITWTTDEVYRRRGQVKAYIDLAPVRPAAIQTIRDHELNGIAWRPELEAGLPADRRRLLITGKQWPAFFVIEFAKI